MILSDEVKNAIKDEFESFKSKMYKGLTKEERKKYGMVYTPAEVSIKMIEKFDCEEFGDQTVLDPCCGSGNLLVACLLAGARADKIFGNELNSKMVKLARRRIQDICDDIMKYPNIRCREKFRGLHHHIHVGDATNAYCLTHFGDRYNFNMTSPEAKKANAAEEDNIPPAEDDSLYSRGVVSSTLKQDCINTWKSITADANYPMAAKDESLTVADYEEILTGKSVQCDDEIINNMLAKKQNKPVIKQKIKQSVSNTLNTNWLFDLYKKE